MPIRYRVDKKGYQYGDTGTIYKLKDYGARGAYLKALEQMKAIKYSQGIVREHDRNSVRGHSHTVREHRRRR